MKNKNKTLLVTVFVIGVGSGAFAHRSLANQPSAQRADVMEADVKQWEETEEKTRTRMSVFQSRLDNLRATPTSDSLQKLGQEMELQRGIDDILIKFREAQQAKFAPFVGGGVVGSLLTLVGQWLAARRSGSRNTPGGLQAGGA